MVLNICRDLLPQYFPEESAEAEAEQKADSAEPKQDAEALEHDEPASTKTAE